MTAQKAHPAILEPLRGHPYDLAKAIATELGHIVGRNAYQGGDLETLSGLLATRADLARGTDEEAIWAEYAALYRRWATTPVGPT